MNELQRQRDELLIAIAMGLYKLLEQPAVLPYATLELGLLNRHTTALAELVAAQSTKPARYIEPDGSYSDKPPER